MYLQLALGCLCIFGISHSSEFLGRIFLCSVQNKKYYNIPRLINFLKLSPLMLTQCSNKIFFSLLIIYYLIKNLKIRPFTYCKWVSFLCLFPCLNYCPWYLCRHPCPLSGHLTCYISYNSQITHLSESSLQYANLLIFSYRKSSFWGWRERWLSA